MTFLCFSKKKKENFLFPSAMPNIRKAVWFSFFWEKQPQRHLCLPFQGKVINIRNQNANNKLMWVGEWGGILLSGLVTVANSYAPRHIYPLLPLMLINQVLSERQLDMQNSLLARKNKNWHSDFWCFFPRKGKTKLQFWYLALINYFNGKEHAENASSFLI